MTSRIRIMSAALAVVAASVISVFGMAGPAHASFQSSWPDHFCIYDGYDGTGSYYCWGSEHYGQCTNIGAPFNDVMSSAHNNYSKSNPTHNWQVLIYRDAGCLGGTVACISFWRCYLLPGESVNATSSNNVASSFRVRSA